MVMEGRGCEVGIVERLGNNDVLACNVQESRVAKVPAEKKAMLQNLVAKVGTHLSEAEQSSTIFSWTAQTSLPLMTVTLVEQMP